MNALSLRLVATIILSALSAFGATLGRSVSIIGGATDLVLDESRNRVYLTSSVQNLIQVYSIQSQSVQTTVTTDQTPLSAAISRNGRFLYVTCYDSSALDVISTPRSRISSMAVSTSPADRFTPRHASAKPTRPSVVC